ncbi:MAG TPA: serine/threonine-protein kinase [Gemmatimonadales bacterium]|nr:serine/threonine-protein kinase [Gemmatimonadales bacterium]
MPPEPETGIPERLQAALADRYRIERQLGAGGMATVFLAHDLRHERDVAIKVLHPELAASMGAERFEREIRLAAKLNHPHILGLFDSGEADNLFYYVMPYVPGESLRDRITREQMLPVDDALQITYEVADALGAAHALGIVHRDIKPENILLAGGHALVADFGVARAASEAGEKLTQTGMAVGTPTYMSPEQAMGDVVGPTSDLYALGCVVYEMLTGQPPFTGANARAIMARHTMEAVPSIRLVRETVPEEVEEAVLALLAKVPADRPQTAKEFLDLLAAPTGTGTTRRLGSRITTARRTAAVVRRPPLWRRPVAWAATGAAVIVLAGGALLLRHRPARVAGGAGGLDPHHIAVLYFRDQSGGKLSYVVDGLTEGLIRALREVPTLSVVSAGGVEQYRRSDLPRDSIARALGAGTLVLGDLEQSDDRLRVTLRLIDGSSGADFDRRSFEQPAGNLVTISDTLAAQAAQLIRRRLGEEIAMRQVRDQARSPEAWSLYQQAVRLKKDGAAADDSTVLARDFARADSLLAQAQRLDPEWADPPVLRGELDYLRSRKYGGDPQAADRWIRPGLVHADEALALDRDDPDALELKGDLRYWRWLLRLEGNPDSAHQLLLAAKADLETAVKLNRAQAGAYATLSHLYYQTGSLTDVYLAARNALTEDAYLDNADVILSRLFFSSYDLGQFPDAENWCTEGRRRFPADYRFTECRLWMMTTRQDSADPRLAWRLLDSVLVRTPPEGKPYQRLYDQAIVAWVLARAGAADSARHLLQRTVADAVTDPTRDIAYTKSMAYAFLGDKGPAIDQLGLYLAANPSKREGLAQDPGWQLAPLANEPAFQALVGTRR